MNKKRLMPIILGAVLLVAGYFGFNKIRFMLSNEDTDNAYLEADITNISPKVQGYIASVRVKENQHVKTGDTLFVLDSRELLLKVKQAEAALQNAIANVGAIEANAGTAGANIATADANTLTSEAGVESTTAAVRTAEANVDAAKARTWQATQDFKRYETLVAQGAVTQQQFDAAKANKENSEAALQAAQAQVETARRQVEVSKRQTTAGQRQRAATATQAVVANKNVALAQTLVAQRKVDLETAQLNLSYTVIVAPTNGTIAKKAVQEGQLVNIGSPLCNLVSDAGIWVTANFKETQVAHMKAGQPVEVKIDAYKNRVFKAVIESIAPATGSKFSLLPPDNASGNFVKVVQRIPVRIAITEQPDPEFPLRAGMSAEVVIPNE